MLDILILTLPPEDTQPWARNVIPLSFRLLIYEVGIITSRSTRLLWKLSKRIHIKYSVTLPGRRRDCFLVLCSIKAQTGPTPSLLLPPFPFNSLEWEHPGSWHLLPDGVRTEEDMSVSHNSRSHNPVPQEAAKRDTYPRCNNPSWEDETCHSGD